MNNSIFSLLTGMPHEKLPSHDFGSTLLAMAEIGKALADRRGMVESLRQLLERKGIPHDFLSDDLQGLTNAIEENASFRQALEETGMLHKFIELASRLEETEPEPGIQLMSEHLAPLIEGWTPLHHAAKDDAPETAAELIETGTNVNVMDANSNTPLHVAALRNAHETAAMLLKHNADPNAKNDEGHTPLHVAALMNAHETTAMLLKHNADPNAKNEKGDTPLHVAALRNAHETAAILLKHNADPNAKNVDGAAREPTYPGYLVRSVPGPTGLHEADHPRYDAISTPLHVAALKDAHETAVELLRHGADVNAQDKEGYTPLHYAVDSKAHKTARRLLNHGADANAKGYWDLSPLHLVIMHNYHEISEMLLRHGADVNAQDKKGYIPAHYAITFDLYEVAKVLERYSGFTASLKAEKGYTILHIAAARIAQLPHVETARVAYQHIGINYFNLVRKDDEGNTPLHIAALYAVMDPALREKAREHNPEMFWELCNTFVADINAKNNEGDTPLHIVVRRYSHLCGSDEIINRLVRSGADINAKNNEGDTPLHVAATHDNRELIMRKLVELGADIKARSNDGKRASNIVKDWGDYHNIVAHHQGRAPQRPKQR